MNQLSHTGDETGDRIAGDHGEKNARSAIAVYAIGFALAVTLTAASFWAAKTHLIYGPAAPFALIALAIGQMGVHLVFFFHITSAEDNTNNILALGFGILIVCLLIFGSMWIMDHLNQNMMPMNRLMHMQ